MSAYRVTLKASGLRATFDGAEIPCGFFKNEFVWAKNSEQAIAKARANVQAALRRNSTVNQNDLLGLEIEVEGFEAGVRLSTLLWRQGFVFHRLDSDEDSSATGE